MSSFWSITIVNAADCKTAIGITNQLEKSITTSADLSDVTVNKLLFKDLKKIKEIKSENNFFIFLVSPYQSGKRSRSIRRFQRKLDNFDAELNKLLFCVVCVNDSQIESNKMQSTLINKRKATQFYKNEIISYSEDYTFDEMLSAINNKINEAPTTSVITPKSSDDINQQQPISIERTPSLVQSFDFTICYGTATGNSKEICNEIVSIALCKNNDYSINGPLELNALNLQRLGQYSNYLIIVVSTTGDGEVPDNGDQFFRKIKLKCLSCSESSKDKIFENINYAILGLGDSNYSKFNEAAKNIDKCLQILGGNKFYHTGYADDGIGLEDVVEPWKEGVIKEMERRLNKQIALQSPVNMIQKVSIINDSNKPIFHYNSNDLSLSSSSNHFLTKFRISKCMQSTDIKPATSRYELFRFGEKHKKNNKNNSQQHTKSFKAYDANNQFLCELISAKYQTAFDKEYRDSIVVHLTLRLPHGYSYEIGDVLCIYPPNPHWIVDALLDRLKFNGNDVIRMSALSEIISSNPLPHMPFKREITIYDVFRYCIDIRTIPKSKLFIKALATFCSNDEEKIKLLNVSSSDLTCSLIELFEQFSSCYPSLECLLHFLGELKPRQYSICSSPNLKPDEVDICFRVLKYDNKVKQSHYDGLCSCFLYSLCCNHDQSNLLSKNELVSKYEYGFVEDKESIKIAVYFKLSPTFKPPSNPSCPLILIGPGTGVAVFRAFLQHRQHQNQLVKDCGNTMICDGAWRGIEMQFSDEYDESTTDTFDTNEIEKEGSAKCVLFFGCRHPEKDYLYEHEWTKFKENEVLDHLFVGFSRYNGQRVYVQHLLKENSLMISNMILNDDAYVFVCGDASKMAKDVERTIIELIALHSKMSLIESTKYVQNMKDSHKYNIDCWNSAYKS